MKNKKIVGLALSGGGYRAAAFHLGTLKKLYELDILNTVDKISSISGGSIIGAFYCYYNKPFVEFENEIRKVLNSKSVIRNILKSYTFIIVIAIFLICLIVSYFICKYISTWLSIPLYLIFIYLIGKYQFRFFPINKEIEKAYNEFLFKDATLSDLKDQPELAIGSTNLQSCRPFTFSKRKMEDSSYAFMDPPIKFDSGNFPIARAVTASTAVPSLFTPIRIDEIFFQNKEYFKLVSPVLVDGGIYDNQGIQKLTQPKSSYECDIIITSDAGTKLPFEGSYNNTYTLILRTFETFMARIKNFQMIQNIYSSSSKEIAYLSLGWDLENCIPGFINNLKAGNISQEIIDHHKIPNNYLKNIDYYKNQIIEILEINCNYKNIFSNNLNAKEIEIARNVKTNLMPLTSIQIDCLAKHSSNLTELQIKLYCPTLFKNDI